MLFHGEVLILFIKQYFNGFWTSSLDFYRDAAGGAMARSVPLLDRRRDAEQRWQEPVGFIIPKSGSQTLASK